MKRIIISLTALLVCMASFAQTAEIDTTKRERNFWRNIGDYTLGILKSASVGVEYRLKAGIALGGALPMPIPLEIREIKGFKPGLNLSIEAEIMKNFSNSDWALAFGLRFERKSMSTDARVQSYQMEMVADDGGKIDGAWTGYVNTSLDANFFTLPILAVWRMSPRWGLKFGLYGSYRASGKFTGAAYDGYLRVGDPTGEKVLLERAGYDLSEDLNRWYYGVQFGAEWRAFPHLIVGLDATCGLNSIFPKDYKTIAFAMYPMYGNLNFGYAF